MFLKCSTCGEKKEGPHCILEIIKPLYFDIFESDKSYLHKIFLIKNMFQHIEKEEQNFICFEYILCVFNIKL